MKLYVTTGCMMYTNIQPVVKRDRFGCIVYTAGCQTSCTCTTVLTTGSTRLSNRFDNRLYRVNGVLQVPLGTWAVGTYLLGLYYTMPLTSGTCHQNLVEKVSPSRSHIIHSYGFQTIILSGSRRLLHVVTAWVPNGFPVRVPQTGAHVVVTAWVPNGFPVRVP